VAAFRAHEERTRGVIAGLAPAIHPTPERFYEDRWIRGSSPRMKN
jgi:hypothetical protein